MNGCLWKFNHSTDDRPERRLKKSPAFWRGVARITGLESAGFVFAKPRLKVGGCRQPVTHYSIVENGVEV